MTVVDFAAARDKVRSEPPHCWKLEETAELMRLYAVLNRQGDATGYEYGETETREPQFYLLGADLAQSGIACVSRISKRGRPWYVIEDGLGGLLAEGYALKILVNQINRCRRSLRANLLLGAWFLEQLLTTADGFIQEDFAVTLISRFAFG